MARVAGSPDGGRAPHPDERPSVFARIRHSWRNASLKTSFMVYMLVFLLIALVVSSATASVFASLQNDATRDAYEMSGLYLYDESTDSLVPARAVEIDENGSSVFVQTVRDDMTSLPMRDVSPLTSITDASDYQYTSVTFGLSGSQSSDETSDALTIEAPEDEDLPAEDLSVEGLPVYDAQARARFYAWIEEHPESPYAAFFSADDDPAFDNGSSSGLLTSPIGYYLSTPPSDEALLLSSLFGTLTFLMFPLWFGLCIFAAARRFFQKRLQPGFTVLDEAASNIAHQDLDFVVAYDRDDELGRLASSFETMRASLAASQRSLWRTAEERKRLNAAFAHDLRTPLTILKGKIELLDAHLQTGDASPERLAASVSSLADQVKRLERYVEAMSGLQKLEDRTITAHDVPFDDAAIMVDDIGVALSAQHGCAFGLSVSPRCDRERPALRLDQSIVGEVAENLLSNAARYACARIDARMDVQDGSLVLIVEDDGPGFSPDALERGCAPFFSEAPSSDHFGLGLNIASLLCEKHGGGLVLENREPSSTEGGGGARVIARFSLECDDVDSR
ncbi:sensor histidine kinase [Eggerthella sinensis]|uniref:sensor histidine kinase n=1 Tax=Eggerthella sinensis TaxID=242230 RepID=UPI001D07BA41|nr:HAMP domain-containing sensor histidine kinase [Eggerthella sinensis]MCB7036801.1 HAMP domain-containing histidine kinase [Eggerthella sinensis]